MYAQAVTCAACHVTLEPSEPVILAIAYVDARLGNAVVPTTIDGEKAVVHARHFPPDGRRWRISRVGPLRSLASRSLLRG